MKRVLIVGAGGFGREVAEWVRDSEEIITKRWELGGFLDKDSSALDGYDIGLPIVGDPDHFVPGPHDVFICALGFHKVKERVITVLLSRGAEFPPLIHPSAIIGHRCVLEEGCVICPRVVITADVRVGRFAMLNLSTMVGHDVRIGAWSTLCPMTNLAGFVRLGARVFTGSQACVIPGKEVGDDAVLGAGCVVVRNVRPGVTVLGVPAKEV